MANDGPASVTLLIAWAAGLFEGEGCITADSRGFLTLTLTSTDRDVVQRFMLATGVGAVRTKQITPNPHLRSQRPQWRWRLHKQEDVFRLLYAFEPYLGARRLARWEELVARYHARPRQRWPVKRVA